MFNVNDMDFSKTACLREVDVLEFG